MKKARRGWGGECTCNARAYRGRNDQRRHYCAALEAERTRTARPKQSKISKKRQKAKGHAPRGLREVGNRGVAVAWRCGSIRSAERTRLVQGTPYAIRFRLCGGNPDAGCWRARRMERRIGGSLAKLFVSLFPEVESMNSDTNARSPEDNIMTYTYDSDGMLILTSERITSLGITTYNDPAESPAKRLHSEHDRQNRLFILTGPDGKTERFRDNPVRDLKRDRTCKATPCAFQPRRVTDGPIWLRDNNLRRGRSRRIRSMISSSFKRDRTCKATPCAFQPRRVTDGPIWLRDNNLRRGRSRRIRSMISSSFGPRCMSLRTMSLRTCPYDVLSPFISKASRFGYRQGGVSGPA